MCRLLIAFLAFLLSTAFFGLFYQSNAFGADDEKIQQDEMLYKDILTGFEDQQTGKGNETGNAAPTREDTEAHQRLIRFSGWFQQRAVYNYAYEQPEPGTTDHRGFSSVRAELAPAAELRFSSDWKVRIEGRLRYEPIFALMGHDNYTSAYVEDRQTEADLWDAFVEASPIQGLSVKVGRQIVVWGTSESMRITDVLNPLDYREPGVTDIENMRLPLTMTRLDYTWHQLTLSGIAIHEFRPSTLPVLGSDFYFNDQPFPRTYEPDDTPDNTEYALSLTVRLTGWDLSLYYADIFSDVPYLIMARGPIIVQPELGNSVLLPPDYENWYSRLKMYGAATTVAYKKWLLKFEAAYFQGTRYFNTPNVEKDLLNLLAGLEYSGFTNTSIAVEYAVQHIYDYEKNMQQYPDMVEENENHAALRILRDFRRDTLHLLVTVNLLDDHGDDGWLARTQVEYDWTDNLSLTLGAVVYGAAQDGKYAALKDNDRFFVRLRYSY
jgi:hypothetical protein